jgi:predicted DNA-binding antitoxin AbrB/MazE fold protein
VSITVDAVYEDGVLKPNHSLPLEERCKVQVTIEAAELSWAKRTHGMLRWTGDVATLDLLALDPDLEYEQ